MLVGDILSASSRTQRDGTKLQQVHLKYASSKQPWFFASRPPPLRPTLCEFERRKLFPPPPREINVKVRRMYVRGQGARSFALAFHPPPRPTSRHLGFLPRGMFTLGVCIRFELLLLLALPYLYIYVCTLHNILIEYHTYIHLS